MKKRSFRLIALTVMICLMVTMTAPGVFADDSAADAYDRLEDALTQAKGESGGSADNTATAETVKLVEPAAAVKALPDSFYDFDNPVDGGTLRKCQVSAVSVFNLADRAYTAGGRTFYIDASHAGKNVTETTIEIETGMYPFSSAGTCADFGILTNDGYLQIRAQAALTLLNENLYKSVTIETAKQSDITYRIVFKAVTLDDKTEYIFDLPEESVTFTVWPKDSFSGKILKSHGRWFSQTGYSGECTWNADGTLTLPAPGTGDYTLQVHEVPSSSSIPNHTLEVVNEEYGSVDMDMNNNYVPGASAGGYLQDVFINGVSQGAVRTIKISEGDEIVVVFSKHGEKTDTSKYDAAAVAAKNEKLKNGVRNTTIKASTVSGVKKGVKITWKKSKGYKVDAYEIWRSTKKSSGYKKTYTTANGKKTSYTNTKTTKGKRYYYRVRGVRTVEGEKVYTQWSNRCYRIAK